MFKRIIYSRLALGTLVVLLAFSVFTTIYAYQIPQEIVQESLMYTYTTKGAFSYVVTLYPNILYNTTVLVNPDRVFLKLVDKVNVNVEYTFTTQPSATSVINVLEVETVVSHPQAWSKKVNYTVIESRENAVRYAIELDIPLLLSLARNISQQIDLPSTRYTITINCNAKTAFTISGATRTTSFPFSLQLDLDLAGKTIEFSKREFSSVTAQKNSVTSANTVSLGVVSISVSTLRQLLVGLSVALSATIVVFTYANVTRLYGSRGRSTSWLTGKYRSLVVEATQPIEVASSRVIKVKSISELVKIAENLAKPIVHFKANGKHYFYLFDGGLTYACEHEE